MPDLTVLAEPSLAFSYGGAGIEREGRWEIFDPSGRRRGSVVVEVQGGLIARRRYVMLDPADQIMLVVDPREGFSNDADVFDYAGRPHGLYDGQTFSDMIRFTIAGAVYGQATARDGTGANAPFVSDDVDHFVLALWDGQGVQFGSLVNHEARRGLSSFFGQESSPGQLQPEQSWFQLDRRPDVAEPLRTFALAFPCVYAYKVHLARQARRHRRHHHH